MPHPQPAPHDELSRRLLDVVNDLAASRDLHDVTAIIRSAARTLTRADGVTFVLREAGQCFYADEDAIEPLWRGQRFPLHQCVSGWVMRTRQPVVIPDVYDDPRVPVDAYRPTFVRSLAMVPVRKADPVAAIGAYWAHLRTPTDEEVATLSALADSASLALANVQLYEELRAALERERQSRQRAEAASHGKDEFLAIISHELRQPLHASVAALEMMARRASREKGEHAREVLSRQLRHMTSLIDDLLDASRVVRNQITVKFDLIDLRRVVDAAVESMQAAIDHQEHRLSIDQPDVPVWVRADPVRLHQVVGNLLSNASKFSPRSSEIGLTLATQAGSAVLVVRDNGRGIEPDVLPSIFELFARGSTDAPGFGIGLAVVDRLVRLHGGTVEVASDGPGLGSTFTLRLPLATPPPSSATS